MIDTDLTDIPFDQSAGLIEETADEILMASPMGSFEDDFPNLMVPRKKRKDMALERWPMQLETIRKIYSQGRTSACVGFGSAQALEVTRTRKYGRKTWVALSGMSVYKEIGRTLMSGAMISDGMRQVEKIGALPLTAPGNEDLELTWGITDWKKRFPRGWEKHAEPYRVAKYVRAVGLDAIQSAMLHGLCGIVGRQRHCIPYVGLKWDTRAGLVVPFANSWSENWGDDGGIGYDSERIHRDLVIYLILEVVINTDELDIPEL